jgi:putative transcriptional regulator
MAKKKKVSPLAKALLETADDMRKAGLMDKATHEKITLRHLGATGAAKARRLRGRKSGPCANGLN